MVGFNWRGPHQARDGPFAQRQAYAGDSRDGRPPGRGLITRGRRPADGCIPEAHILPHRGWSSRGLYTAESHWGALNGRRLGPAVGRRSQRKVPLQTIAGPAGSTPFPLPPSRHPKPAVRSWPGPLAGARAATPPNWRKQVRTIGIWRGGGLLNRTAVPIATACEARVRIRWMFQHLIQIRALHNIEVINRQLNCTEAKVP